MHTWWRSAFQTLYCGSWVRRLSSRNSSWMLVTSAIELSDVHRGGWAVPFPIFTSEKGIFEGVLKAGINLDPRSFWKRQRQIEFLHYTRCVCQKSSTTGVTENFVQIQTTNFPAVMDFFFFIWLAIPFKKVTSGNISKTGSARLAPINLQVFGCLLDDSRLYLGTVRLQLDDRYSADLRGCEWSSQKDSHPHFGWKKAPSRPIALPLQTLWHKNYVKLNSDQNLTRM